MATGNKYVIQHTEMSYCPKCRRTVDLLAPYEDSGDMFYICWHDGIVFQVGVGEVQREET